MEAFITRHYRLLLILLVTALMILSFLIGFEEGKVRGAGGGIVLSCSEDVLSSLAIPTGALARGEAVPEGPSVLSGTVGGQGKYFGSKNGTKYYTPGCPAGNRIKPENYLWFENEADARLQGYTAASC